MIYTVGVTGSVGSDKKLNLQWKIILQNVIILSHQNYNLIAELNYNTNIIIALHLHYVQYIRVGDIFIYQSGSQSDGPIAVHSST